MEVVLAEVEGRESKSSEDDGDAARGILSYDWSDMFVAFVWMMVGKER